MSEATEPFVSVMDIGGTHVTAARVDLRIRRVVPGHLVREELDSAGSAEQIVEALAHCAARLPHGSAGPWSIALPGPFDYARGIGLYEGVGKFDRLHGIDLRAALLQALPLSTQIDFLNDADAFLLGEWWTGAARGHRKAVGITLGTGVGSCFLRDGRAVEEDPSVPAQGRVDLLTFDGSPLEQTVSRRAIQRAYAQLGGAAAGEAPDVREIAIRARAGDDAAHAAISNACRALSSAIAPWLASFEATVLVVGGSIAESWDLVAGPLRAGIAEASAAKRTSVLRARHLHEAALFGAAHRAATALRANSR